MIRRRRRTREIPFSLDSFLDVVANVVGIIIKLILVVWVGARSYNSIVPMTEQDVPDTPAVSSPSSKPLPDDPLQLEIARHRAELQQAQARLLEQLRLLPQSQDKQEQAKRYMGSLAARLQTLTKERTSQEQALAEEGKAVQGIHVSMAELRQRSKRLAEEIAAMEKLPPARKVLHYRTPVSRLVHTEELHFECRRGRVTFVDLFGFHRECEQSILQRKEELSSAGRIDLVTQSSGPFRMRWTVELSPHEQHVDVEGVVEPLSELRGETLDIALAQGSEFRHIVDGADPGQTVVTFWVYPDSFPVYRKLRDFLYGRDMEVAGRVLPEGAPIGSSSRHGSKSRGQ